jgi:hypothetical protein
MLDLWARRKGLDLIGTGDFTHALWREEAQRKADPRKDGLYVLKDEYRLSDERTNTSGKPRSRHRESALFIKRTARCERSTI